MDTNSHYGHLSVHDGRSLRVAKFFWLSQWGDASPASLYGVCIVTQYTVCVHDHCTRSVAYLAGGAVVRPLPLFGLTMNFWRINSTFFLRFCRHISRKKDECSGPEQARIQEFLVRAG
jgi:hypothetical protein